MGEYVDTGDAVKLLCEYTLSGEVARGDDSKRIFVDGEADGERGDGGVVQAAIKFMDAVLIGGTCTGRGGDLLTLRMGRSQVIGGGVRGMGVLATEASEVEESSEPKEQAVEAVDCADRRRISPADARGRIVVLREGGHARGPTGRARGRVCAERPWADRFFMAPRRQSLEDKDSGLESGVSIGAAESGMRPVAGEAGSRRA